MELVVMWHISSTKRSLGLRLPQKTRQLSDRSGRRGKRPPSSQILDYGTTYGLFQGKRRKNIVGGKAGNGRDLGFTLLGPVTFRFANQFVTCWSRGPHFTFYKIPFYSIRECGGDTTKRIEKYYYNTIFLSFIVGRPAEEDKSRHPQYVRTIPLPCPVPTDPPALYVPHKAAIKLAPFHSLIARLPHIPRNDVGTSRRLVTGV